MKLWETKEDNEKNIDTIEEFLSGNDVGHDEILLNYDILGNIAHCKMLNEVGILSNKEWESARDILRDISKQKIEINKSEEDVHTKVENLVAEKSDVGEKIHTGRSRNDQVVLDTRLFLKDETIEISKQTLEIISKLIQQADKYEETVMPGYTHHQQAMPSTVGLWFASFADALKDDIRNFEGTYDVIDQNPLGAAASYGTTLPIDRDLTAKYLGFSNVQTNSLYSVSSRGKIESMIMDDLDQIILDINRFATDLVLFSTQEFDLVNIDDSLVTGSSIMPQKRNPDVAEILKGRTNRLMGSSDDIKDILSNNMSGYNRDSQETKTVLFSYLEEFREILEVFSLLVEGISFNEKKLRESLNDESYSAFTANKLVEQGTPFRKAYQKVKKGEINLVKDNEFLKNQSVKGSPGNLALDNLNNEVQELSKTWKNRGEEFEKIKYSLLG